MKLSATERAYIAEAARQDGVEPAAYYAIVEVESNGVTHATVNGVKVPVIRWEGHYFDRLVPAKKRAQAREEGLANPKAGAVLNPANQASRYAILAKGIKIDSEAAYSSISVGIGQVMGSHWEWLGYRSAQHLFTEASKGFEGQFELMRRYIKEAGLLDELQRHDWAGFARGYNGPAYAKYGYHTKIAKAYRRYAGREAPKSPASGMLRMGSAGARVREMQQLLVRAGYTLDVDGDFGPATRDVVREFQRDNGLDVDGVAGPKTMAALDRFRIDPDETIGALGALETDEGKQGVGGAGVGVGLTVAAEQINSLAERIGMQGFTALDYAASGLYVLSGVLVLGGLAWAAYGYLKAQKTYEGVS